MLAATSTSEGKRMPQEAFPPLVITKHWAALNDHLVELVDWIPDDTMDWTPSADVWSCRALFLHIAGARHHWMTTVVADGETMPDLLTGARTRDGLKAQLYTSWDRMTRFLLDPDKLAARYAPPLDDPLYPGDPTDFDGHFIAFHRLVHDAHHRADIFHLLRLAQIDVPIEQRRRPL